MLIQAAWRSKVGSGLITGRTAKDDITALTQLLEDLLSDIEERYDQTVVSGS